MNETEGSPASPGTRSNLAALVITRSAQIVSGLIVSLVVARWLSREDYGLYRWVWAVVSVATVGSTLGLDALITRRVARDPESAGRLVPLVLQAAAVLAVPTTLAIVGYVALRDPRPEVVLLALLGALTLAGQAAAQMVTGVLLGLRKLGGEVAPVLGGRLLFTVGQVVAVAVGGGLVSLYGVRLAASWLTVAMLLAALGRTVVVSSWAVEPGEVTKLIRAGRAFGATVFFGAIYAQADLLLLEAMRGEVEVARYAAPASVLLQLALVANIVSRGVFPRMAQLATEPAAAGELLALQARVLLAVSVPIAVGGVVVAPDLIPWLFGEAYNDAVLPFTLLVIAVPLRFLNAGFGVALTAHDRQRQRARVDLLGAVFNVGLNLYAVPRWGAEGAALVTLGTDLLLCVVLRWELAAVLPRMGLWRAALPCLLASAVMGAAVWSASALHVGLRLGLGVVVFVAVGWLVGAWSTRDLRALRRV